MVKGSSRNSDHQEPEYTHEADHAPDDAPTAIAHDECRAHDGEEGDDPEEHREERGPVISYMFYHR